jgi:D-3-phosphoglycerate dehydrogenase
LNPHFVFIADDFHPVLISELKAANIHFDYQPNAQRNDILSALVQGATGLILRSKTAVDKELLNAGQNLKFIGRGGAGMDNIDIDAAANLGIACFNSGNANSNAVGEQTLGMLLSLFRKIHTADAEIRLGKWQREPNRGIELMGKTVGIIGYGNAGSAFAKLLSGFNVNIIAYDKYKKNYGNSFVKESNLAEIFEKAEILSLHVPLDSHTTFMVNSDFLHRFVNKIFLLNLSRGEILRTADVVNALQIGKISGFAADVLENEKITSLSFDEKIWFNALTSMPNVVLSPHIGGWTQESYCNIAQSMAAQIISHIADNQ